MRLSRPRRALVLLALAMTAITCTDAPTAPSASRGSAWARVGIAPTFPSSAARAYDQLAQLGFDITSVRARLTAVSGRVALDTVVAFPTTQQALVLDLPVEIDGIEETFTALIELRDASGKALFTGVQLVTARSDGLPGALPSPFSFAYSGPGRDARTLSIAPFGGVVSAADALTLTAAASDSAGADIGDLLVAWSSSDAAIATVVPSGATSAVLHGSGKRGPVTITVSTPTGLTTFTTFTLVPPAARLTIVGGDGQTGLAGRPLAQPFVVELRASDGGPVPNSRVAFRAVDGGTVSAANVVTDSSGRASVTITPGTRAATYTFEALAPSLAPAMVSATAAPALATRIFIASGDGQTDAAGSALATPLVVIASDDFGGPVAGATVDWTKIGGFGSLDSTQSTTDANGRASMSYTLGYRTGVDLVRASLRGVVGANVDFTLRTVPGPASTMRLLQALAPVLSVGAAPANPITVQVADAFGTPVTQAGVTIVGRGVLSPGGTQAISVSATTDARGIATFAVPAYVGPEGTVVLSFAAPGFATLELPAVTLVAGAVARMRVKTQPSISTSSGAPLAVQPVVKLYDVGWNDVKKGGVVITAYVASGSGMLSGTTTAISDVSGTAAFTDLAITGAPGTQVLGFSTSQATDVFSDPIDLTAPVAALEVAAGWPAPTTASNGSTLATFKVRLVDALGQPVARSGVPITVGATALVGPTAAAPLFGTLTRLTDANGVAVFDDVGFSTLLGDYSLTATSDPVVLPLPVLTLVGTFTLTN